MRAPERASRSQGAYLAVVEGVVKPRPHQLLESALPTPPSTHPPPTPSTHPPPPPASSLSVSWVWKASGRWVEAPRGPKVLEARGGERPCYQPNW